MAAHGRLGLALFLAGLLGAGPAAGDQLVTREAGAPVVYRVDAATPVRLNDASAPRTPLGSVWKLFVYAYLVARQQDSADYVCRGGDPEEVYCCEAGGRIGREAALVKSCGRYFEPAHLKLDAHAWARFWQHQGAPAWLGALDALNERTEVSTASLLDALDAVPAEARETTGATLLGLLDTRAAGATVRHTGGRVRAKTWTLPTGDGGHQGGAAGWFANGQPFWLGGRGAGIAVLRHAAPALARLADALPVPDEAGCVDVRFFARNPIDSLTPERPDQPTRGRLRGAYRVHFANGNTLPIASAGELRVDLLDGHPVIFGRLGTNDYVARVLDREAAATPREAARALAVVARSYLLENGRPGGACLAIDDSSRYQRVAPRPASAAARAVADWSTGLVLTGTPVRFHRDEGGPGVLAWQEAVRQAKAGRAFDEILRVPFPQATLAGPASGPDVCRSAPEAAEWLAGRVHRWSAQLQAEPGYLAPAPLPTLCLTSAPRPFADPVRNRIYTRGWARTEDRVALAHEYLHLAFDGHPLSRDEHRIEALARQLVLGSAP